MPEVRVGADSEDHTTYDDDVDVSGSTIGRSQGFKFIIL